MSNERPAHQRKTIPKETRSSRLANNPSESTPMEQRTLGALRIDLPGAFHIPADTARFAVRTRDFTPDGSGTSLTPIEKRKVKKPRN